MPSLFSVQASAKDAALIEQAAEAAKVRLDIAEAVSKRLARVIDHGHGDEDMVATYFASFSGDRHAIRAA